MKKINFVNGATIDGAETFNDMQSNVEEVFNGEEPMGSIVVDDVVSKNLLPISESETITLSKKIEFDEPLQAGKYYLSVESFTTNGTVGKYLFQFNPTDGSDGYYPLLTDTIYSRSLDLPKECKSVNIYSQQDWATSRDITTTFNKLMLTKGDTLLPYTPYKKFGYNSTDSMGKIVVDDISCKNKFNKYGSLNDSVGWTSGATTLQSNGTIRATANIANGNGKGQFINVKPNTKYTISFRVIEMEIEGTYNVRIRTVGLETNSTLYTYENTSTGYKTFTFTTNECNTIWVSICGIGNASSVNTFKYVIYDEIQVEENDKATSYTPYKEFSTTKRNLYNDSLLNSNYCGGSTNLKEMYLYNNGLVVINFSVTLNNTITANTSTQLVTIPSELLPNKNIGLMTININKEGKEVAYINSGEGKIRWRSSVNAVAGDEIYIQGTYVKDEGLSTSTQTASTMSLRPDTTEMEETE